MPRYGGPPQGLKSTRRFNDKVFRFHASFSKSDGKRTVKAFAKSLRDRGAQARVVEYKGPRARKGHKRPGGGYAVYVRGLRRR